MATREEIFNRISLHRDAMDKKHKEWSLNRRQNFAMTILMEEVGEVARAILEGDETNLIDELYDVGQVVVAWLEGITDIEGCM